MAVGLMMDSLKQTNKKKIEQTLPFLLRTFFFLFKIWLPTLPMMPLVITIDNLLDYTSFLWNPNRLYTTLCLFTFSFLFVTYVTCIHTLICKMAGVTL